MPSSTGSQTKPIDIDLDEFQWMWLKWVLEKVSLRKLRVVSSHRIDGQYMRTTEHDFDYASASTASVAAESPVEETVDSDFQDSFVQLVYQLVTSYLVTSCLA